MSARCSIRRIALTAEEAMPTDRYTNAVLTVIAASLLALVIQNATPKATAQARLSCPASSPCYITNSGITPLNIIDAHAAAAGGTRMHGLPPSSGQYK
jgi:hypothetical protein